MRPVPLHARQDEYVCHLPYSPPYDWESLLAFLEARAIPGVEEIASGAYRRSFAWEGQHGILEVRREATIHCLEARIRFPEPLCLLPIVTRLKALFDVAADSSAIAEHLRRDPLLARLVQRYPGLRVPGAWDGFELAVRAILGQQVSVAAASTLAGRLARRFGEPLSVPDTGGLSVVFPAARVLASARLTGLPQVRARAIRSLARLAVAGRLPLCKTDEAVLAELSGVKGIGEWTVQYIAMRALRQPDAFPAGDLALRRMVGRGGPLTQAALAKRAERWRPWRAQAAIFLWRAAADEVDDPPAVAWSSPPPLRSAGAKEGRR